MRFRKLRIAWSVGCAVACVLLIALWVRSYQYAIASYNGPKFGTFSAGVTSISGVFILRVNVEKDNDAFLIGDQWKISELDADQWRSLVGETELPWSRIWGMFGYENGAITTPYWFDAILLASLAAVPWIRWSKRFTLCTLLIATTIIALVLGAIVWAAA